MAYQPTTGGGTAASSGGPDPFGGAGFNVLTGGPVQQVFHDSSNTVSNVGSEDAGQYAKDHLSNLTAPEIKALQKQLQSGGYLPSGHQTGLIDAATINAYKSLLQDTYYSNQTGSTYSPQDYLAKTVDALGTSAGASSQTSTSSQVATPDDARGLAMTVFLDKLGRKPTQKQLDAFTAALQSYDQSHPQVTQSQQTQGTNGTSNSLTTGGPNDQQFAQQYVDQSFGGEEGTHDALHYFDLIAQTLNGPPSGISHAA